MNLARRRGAHAAAPTASGRYPIGTPNTHANTPFSHIRLLRQEDDYFDDEDEEEDGGIPIFTSPSYQVLVASTSASANLRLHNSSTEVTSSASGHTFADMARAAAIRSSNEKQNAGDSSQNSGPTPLSGLVKLKPHRNRGGKSWKPLDFGEFYLGGDDNDPFFAGLDKSAATYEESIRSANASPISAAQIPKASASEFERVESVISSLPASVPSVHSLGSGTIAVEPANPTGLTSGTISAVSGDEISRVFGERLPDPVFLTQWPGKDHGEIKFIGHPNRDVSAHQWDSISFQWVNIGQFSAIRRKIEGQLAAERLRGQTISSSIPPNTLAYFRAVSKQREAVAMQTTGRTDDTITGPVPQRIEPVMPQRPKLQVVAGATSMDQFGSLSTVSGTGNLLPTRNTLGLVSSMPVRESAPSVAPSVDSAQSSSTTNTRENGVRVMPEDPFVIPHDRYPSLLHRNMPDSGRHGTMDLHYQFPEGQFNNHFNFQPRSSHNMLGGQTRDMAAFSQSRGLQDDPYSSQPYRDTKANNGRPDSRFPNLNHGKQSQGSLSTLRADNSTTFTAIANEIGIDNNTVQTFLKSYEVADDPADTKILFAGRPTSTLAQSLVQAGLQEKGSSEISHDEYVSGFRLDRPSTAAQSLQFSDPERPPMRNPDILTQNHADPTPQNFGGSFFSDKDQSKSKQQEMDEWWHSGSRNHGQSSERTLRSVWQSSEQCNVDGKTQYNAAPILLRVYENFAAYATGPRNYFSRWTTPASHLLDKSENGNKSILDRSYGKNMASARSCGKTEW